VRSGFGHFCEGSGQAIHWWNRWPPDTAHTNTLAGEMRLPNLPVILVPNRSNGLTNAKFKMTPAARVLVVGQPGGVKQARLFEPERI
jgi:hypothetical protein